LVPVVASCHQASLAAFSAGATRASNPEMNVSISAGEDKVPLLLCGSLAD
jgi:hypothetical protein